MTQENQNSLEGKFALVTGASKGIGRAAAVELARMGASVAVNYHSSKAAASETEKLIKNYGVDSLTVRADVGNLDDVNSMIDSVNDRFGQIDILVNNAGIIDDGLLLRMTDEAWKNVIDTNLNGTFYCTRAVIRSMVRSRWGRVINVGSVVGLRGNVGQTNYTASKAGIIGFTYALAKEVATRNITVNTVTPGYVNTETVEGLTQKQKDMIMNWIPMQRFGEVDDIAGMIGYLASPRASYVTGQVISVDGGMAI
ncbi:MAG: 3-oxoacyl-[acyl-carrier-protein] reductase [SAR202 cluster bacterium]|jgi:3-oxoacyl-[acyl-carrier protein] reductase|nr:3-oxoacyl-[acyl-carrier-protein] reductase [SAR202 cluster bacterium]|tara:strand:- start:11923 stop:12684 length:762 start_codon:yes stop_codon:yes gene_type:complete